MIRPGQPSSYRTQFLVVINSLGLISHSYIFKSPPSLVNTKLVTLRHALFAEKTANNNHVVGPLGSSAASILISTSYSNIMLVPKNHQQWIENGESSGEGTHVVRRLSDNRYASAPLVLGFFAVSPI